MKAGAATINEAIDLCGNGLTCVILLPLSAQDFQFLEKSDFDSKMSCPFWQDFFVATAWLRLWDELAVGREKGHAAREGAARQWIHQKGWSLTSLQVGVS